ncbi:BLUF domain-containing protein [Thiorhodococcus mannitoliphagus]|uniref:BLUF domain-containing protein n=1 Tax=Thiorhodococcus mannitoliphagus TaxID=329406 RepID=A0A6P1DTW4_9GAMM|nr:BLUF domain-containing protein [Thiorhodococcus mannitoliphagus]NEX19482.1 BLUF domain-containing protein [Thiorhodococcus mannitoliphagus]
MDKVRSEPRRRDMRIVIEGPARRRVFLDWGMLVRDLTPGPNESDYTSWPGRRLSFLDLAEDPRTCYVYLTAYARDGFSEGVIRA